MYRLLCLAKSRFEGALYRVLLARCADGIYRTRARNSNGIYRRKSYDVFLAARRNLYRHTVIFIYSRGQISFQIFTEPSRRSLGVVVLTVDPRDRTPFALLSGRQ